MCNTEKGNTNLTLPSMVENGCPILQILKEDHNRSDTQFLRRVHLYTRQHAFVSVVFSPTWPVQQNGFKLALTLLLGKQALRE